MNSQNRLLRTLANIQNKVINKATDSYTTSAYTKQ